MSAESKRTNVGVGWARIADRNVELVGGDHAKRGIAILPPELVADGSDFYRIGGLTAS